MLIYLYINLVKFLTKNIIFMKRKTLILALASSMMLLASCKKNSELKNVSPVARTEDASEIHVCTDKTLEGSDEHSGARVDAALLSSKKWVTGQTIRIKFLNGDAFLQGKVKQYAAQWLSFANLNFQYVAASASADIKIAFKWNNDGGSWSYLGIDSKSIGQASPSMNFGWFTSSTSESEFSRVIIHEFGHALGLVHEHQSPAANIPWDKPKVYAYYGGAPNYWTTAQVDNNIFAKYSTSQTSYSAFDVQSIMLYAIPASLTTNGFSTPTNTVLSATDKSFIANAYPYPKNKGNVLYGSQLLLQNQYLQSTDGRFRLIMQTDGNLVLYKNGTQAIWASNTSGRPYITKCVMQGDGNLVLYNDFNTAYWNSGTWQYAGAYATIQNDGNFVIYQNGVARWHTNTWMYN
jgi:hypothetical protein